MRVKCIDNTLQKDLLTIGNVYEVLKIDDYYGDYKLIGYDQNFSKRRFIEVDEFPSPPEVKEKVCSRAGRFIPTKLE